MGEATGLVDLGGIGVNKQLHCSLDAADAKKK